MVFRTERQPRIHPRTEVETATVNFAMRSAWSLLLLWNRRFRSKPQLPSQLLAGRGRKYWTCLEWTKFHRTAFVDSRRQRRRQSASDPAWSSRGDREIAYPAINGQSNRSNMFLLDGVTTTVGFRIQTRSSPPSTMFLSSRCSPTTTNRSLRPGAGWHRKPGH